MGAVGILSVLPWIGTLWSIVASGRADSGRDGGGGEGDHTVVILRNGEIPWNVPGGTPPTLRHRHDGIGGIDGIDDLKGRITEVSR